MRVFVTGSSTGLGLAAAEALVQLGHDVVIHARSAKRAQAMGEVVQRVHGVVTGDLSIVDDVRSIAAQANSFGTFDAVIHNAGVYVDRSRVETVDGHCRVLAVNVLAPYLLTVLMERPQRLVYLSSGMHTSGDPSLDDIDWTTRAWNGVEAYCDSKLLVTALAAGVARRWPAVLSNSVDPGWVPTRMGGPNAPDDLVQGHQTQVWLAISDEDEARATGQHWFHQRRQPAAPAATDPSFQDAVMDRLATLTGVRLT